MSSFADVYLCILNMQTKQDTLQMLRAADVKTIKARYRQTTLNTDGAS